MKMAVAINEYRKEIMASISKIMAIMKSVMKMAMAAVNNQS